jgi:hypothetical protein
MSGGKDGFIKLNQDSWTDQDGLRLQREPEI